MKSNTIENLDVIKQLFNCGKLTMESADWYRAHGYAVIVRCGQVVNIVKEDED